MENMAMRIAKVSALLFIPIENTNIARLSPFVFYSLYQAAAVHLRMWKLEKRKEDAERLDSLKFILGYFNSRWRAGGIMPSLTLTVTDILEVPAPC